MKPNNSRSVFSVSSVVKKSQGRTYYATCNALTNVRAFAQDYSGTHKFTTRGQDARVPTILRDALMKPNNSRSAFFVPSVMKNLWDAHITQRVSPLLTCGLLHDHIPKLFIRKA